MTCGNFSNCLHNGSPTESLITQYTIFSSLSPRKDWCSQKSHFLDFSNRYREANYWRSKLNTYRGISRHICTVTDLSNNLEENYGKIPYLWEFSSLGFCPRQSRSCSVRRWDIYSHRCINSNWLSKNLSLLTCFVNATAQCYTFSLRLKHSLKDCTFRHKKLRSSTARSNK